ncbi:MAG: prolipoprotein diacylglyceryl transferase [Chloroflexi bacterium RBG_13_51_18]|nr:MAG: prolipoprotein diacylglyceryl transferase [Chloroflexi bacterium RBG_13_51_18]
MIYVNIDPVAFSIGSINVGWYGIMVALAVVTLVTWALTAVKKDPRLSYNIVINAALVGIPSGVIFSRLLHVIDHWSYYYHNPGQIVGGSGLSIWGAVLGAALGIWLYNLFAKHSFGHMADMLAPGIILAQAIGRVGCTILGDDTGLPTSLPWGFVYTSPNSPTNQAVGLTPTHPVVTYEIIYAIILFGILLLLWKKLKPDGSLFLVYLAFYSVWRIGSDFLREGTDFLFGLHQAQVIGVIVLVICIVLIAWKTRWVKKEDTQ